MLLILLVLPLMAAAAGPAGPARPGEDDEAVRTRALSEALKPRSVVSSSRGVVVSAAPEASWAGARVLEAGGNAVDAAVAAALALTAADPGGSGLGGQTWMVLRLASGESRAILCPSPAPARIDQKAMKAAYVDRELWGPKAAAVPTTVATLAYALERYGTMAFAEVVGPAIEAAESGYRTQHFEHGYLGDYRRRLFDSEVLAPAYLTGPVDDSGYPAPGELGTCVKIPNLARTLRRLAENGPWDFYSGGIAADLEREVGAAGGYLSRPDLARVRSSVRDVEPVRGTFRGYEALSVPAPAGGGTLVMALQILDALDPGTLRSPGLARAHAIVEAVRLARAQTARTLGQTEVGEGPFRSAWLSREWAEEQARRIRPGRALSRAEVEGSSSPPGGRGTSHLSVVDASGNVVSLTQTLARYYGAAWAAPSLGFPLNGFLEPVGVDDGDANGRLGAVPHTQFPVAPLVLLREGRPVVVAGAAGSSRIPSILLSLVVGLVDGGDRPEEAHARPRLLWEDDDAGPRVMLEVAPPFVAGDVARLEEMGYGKPWVLDGPKPEVVLFGGIYAAYRGPGGEWTAIVDGRRAGTVGVPSHLSSRSRAESSR